MKTPTITLKDFLAGKVSKKEYADYVEQKLVEQGCRAVNVNGSCAYRGENDTACGIGHTITDEEMVVILSEDGDAITLGVHHVVGNNPLLFPPSVGIVTMGFLRRVQSIHDTAKYPNTFVEDIEDGFASLRKVYFL